MTTEDLWVSSDGSRRLVANGRTLARLDAVDTSSGQWVDTCRLTATDARALRALADERSRLERERDEAVGALRGLSNAVDTIPTSALRKLNDDELDALTHRAMAARDLLARLENRG